MSFHFYSNSFSISSFPYLHFSLPAVLLRPQARHYYQIIKRPMDLSIIRRKLQKKDPAHYTTPEEVVSDVRLMFWNCAKFNYVCLCMSCLFYLSPISQWPQDCHVGGVSALVLGCFEDLGVDLWGLLESRLFKSSLPHMGFGMDSGGRWGC